MAAFRCLRIVMVLAVAVPWTYAIPDEVELLMDRGDVERQPTAAERVQTYSISEDAEEVGLMDRSDVERQPTEMEKMRIRYLGVQQEEEVQEESNEDLVTPYESCTSGEYYPSPNGCGEYLQCDNDKLVPFKCAAGLHWDKTNNVCNHPQNAGCELDGDANEAVPELGGGDNQIVPGIDDGLLTVVGQVIGQPAPEPTTAAPTTAAPTTAAPTTAAPTTAAPTQAPAVTAVPAIPQGADTGMKVVCYFTNWAWYRPGLGKFVPEDIDPSLCTHINYGFVVLDKVNLVIKIHDSWADVDNEFFKRVAAMKKKGSKVLLALGGWNDSLGDHYHRLVKDPAARRRFIEHALKFIQKYEYDGLDLDWEYPVCWQTKCRDDAKSDKADFLSWVIELKQEFSKHGLLLTAALSPNPKIIDLAYDLPELNKYLDIFNVMTYDYYGAWDKKAGHHSPLYHHPNHSHPEFSADNTMKHYVKGGVDKSKLVMGMPTYGRMFTLNDQSENFIGADGSAGKPGEFTRSGGFDSYYEICRFIQTDGYKVVRDPENRIGPYAVKGNQWVGYDDVESIRQKSEYVRSEGYGGGMIWALDLDDFNGCFCGQGRYPLLSEINRVLRGKSGANAAKGNCVAKNPWERFVYQGLPLKQPLTYATIPYQPLTYVHHQPLAYVQPTSYIMPPNSPLRHIYTYHNY